MKKKLLMICSSLVLSLTLTGTSFAADSQQATNQFSGFSYNSNENVFSVGSDLKNAKVSKADSHLSLSYSLEGKNVSIEADYYSNIDFEEYTGEAVINDSTILSATVITNENGLSGLVYDEQQNVDHGFVIDYNGEINNKSNEVISTLNQAQTEELQITFEEPQIGTMAASRNFVAHLSHKPVEGAGVRTGFNEGWLHYTRYTNSPDGIRIYFDKLVASIETLGSPFASFLIKNEDAAYGILYTTNINEVTQEQKTYPVKTTSTSAKNFIFKTKSATKATVGGLPIYGWSGKEIILQ
ncbi:hypothetical protein [Paenibacillus faecalis]|uniref:hypothetical protein n=1 Tax=Paenibacillus faecalis TaxID=2079532 RepID=UPI000D0E9F09|nr:hypothetical protein [Paenibacillus faecalis]